MVGLGLLAACRNEPTPAAPVIGDLQPATVVQQLKPAVARFVAGLPVGYSIEIGGTVGESGKGERPIADVIPLMLFLMATGADAAASELPETLPGGERGAARPDLMNNRSTQDWVLARFRRAR